jgi:diamine N-acetyltransferase
VLEGETVRLRPVHESEVAQLTEWFNDAEVRFWLHHSEREDATPEDRRPVYIPQASDSLLSLAIEGDGRLVGVIHLVDIDRTHGRAELAIVIGQKSAWSRGYGTDAMRTLLRHAFGEMGLRRVHLVTDADNARGIRAYEKAGFVHEGTLRKHRLRLGEPIDMIVMSVLREEWKKRDSRAV